jgi:nucleoside-diphosphate-sugar epimerase
MKVLVAGATGAVGLPTVRALLDAGHEVVGTTRSEGKRGLIESAGARAVVMDALDAGSVRRAVNEVKPDAIVQLLTDLPKRGPVRASELTATTRLRIDGTRNLVAAAREANVGRYVSESIVLGYMPGRDRAATESDPFAETAGRESFAEPLRALAFLDEQVRGIGGIVLRMGLYYGDQSGSQQFMAKLARRRLLMMPTGTGLLPWVHVDDVAAAVVAALERGRPGEAYNIVGDEPATPYDLAAAVARSVGARPPRKMPRWLVRLALPYMGSQLGQSYVVSNEKAKRELGWTPRYPRIEAALGPASVSSRA